MVSLPLWAVFTISFGSPILAFLGVLVAQAIARKGASELETRSRREETMRVLRWAAQLAVSDDAGQANLGVYELNALADSDLLDDSQALFVEAALGAVIDTVTEAIEEAGEAGEDTDVAAAVGPEDLPDGVDPDVP